MTKNPLGLKIGQKVKVTGLAYFMYNADNFKEMKLETFDKPKTVYILRAVKKAEGNYKKGNRGGWSLDFYDDGYPPEFKAKKYHTVYEVAESITSKTFFVHPSQIVK